MRPHTRPRIARLEEEVLVETSMRTWWTTQMETVGVTKDDQVNHRYTSSRVVSVAINYTPSGEIFDWACYWGTEPEGGTFAQVCENSTRHGIKLQKDVACALYAALPADKYRR